MVLFNSIIRKLYRSHNYESLYRMFSVDEFYSNYERKCLFSKTQIRAVIGVIVHDKLQRINVTFGEHTTCASAP